MHKLAETFRMRQIRRILGAFLLIAVAFTPMTGCPSNENEVEVPSVVGMSRESAGIALAVARLAVGSVTEQDTGGTVPTGQVISQNPPSGTLVTPGSSVTLIVAGSPAQPTVPNVVGMTQSAAQSAIMSAGLAVGSVTQQNNASVPIGQVISQNPPAGTQVASGSSVSLSVSIGSAQPVLNVSPGTRPVDEEAGSTTFAVSNSGGGTMSWSATVTSGSWLRITSAASGTNNGTITVGFDANENTVARTGTISVVATGAIGSPVTLDVQQAAASEPPPGTEQSFAGIEFRWCPSGSFLMGSYPNEIDSKDDEHPQHKVTFNKGFWMSKYETTQAEWRSVMGSNPSGFPGDGRPVEQVSWNRVQQFIQILNNANPTMNFRLPSEAEWEYACRAGTITRFYWGDDPSYTQIGAYAWVPDNSGGGPHNVGGKLPNAWGLYDMSGNVAEYCQDWYHDGYSGVPTDGSAWVVPAGSNRVLRGGAWAYERAACRSACRILRVPDNAESRHGFRLARTP